MKTTKENLTPSQQARYDNITYLAGSVALLGSIGGIIYAKKTGGGFWRYVGYWIAGGLVAGIPARLVALPFQNKILREVQEGATQQVLDAEKDTQNTKDVKIDRGATTPVEAKEMISALQSGKHLSTITEAKSNSFTEAYNKKITKDVHPQLVAIAKKPQVYWKIPDTAFFGMYMKDIMPLLK